MTKYLMDCLEEGKEIEVKGIKFYNDAADSIDDPKGKATLLFLAKEEGSHLEYIKEIIDSISSGKNTSQIIHKKAPEIFPKKEDFKESAQAGKGDKKILEEAMEIEERSIKFYQECLDRADDDEKKIFENLINEEENHKEWLDYMKDGMEVHGNWYGLDEGFSFDGS